MQLPFANLQLKHWNPGATAPLILPVHLICNTSDEDIYSNIRENSKRPGKWLKLSPAHDRIAIICGSGPSIKKKLGAIEQARGDGATIFALNGCARFLADNGILPDYQVLLDAREETANLVGPAKAHLFASQVHPECFKRAPDAQLWHLQVTDFDSLIPPDYEDGYCLIGGAASVGNTAACLAYAMGYRNLQLYGYDSSHAGGVSHAFRQPMNDGEPCALVTFNGKEYLTSLTMKLQAEKFQETARAIQNMGCAIEVHGSGLLPDMWNTPFEELSEREKYQRMWTHAAYRTLAPGEDCAADFLEHVKPSGLVIDFGCGTGRGALKIKEDGCDVVLVDFADNCRDDEAKALPFVEHDLSETITLRAAYGYCTDVMEHIPPQSVETVIRNIMEAAKTVFFQISTVPDMAGAIINQTLHLTVKPHDWWLDLFERLGFQVSFAKDLGNASQFVVHQGKN